MAAEPTFRKEELSLVMAILRQATTETVDFSQVANDMEASCGKLTASAVNQRWNRFAKKHLKVNSESKGKQSVLGNARVTKSGMGKIGGKGRGGKKGEKMPVKKENEMKHEDMSDTHGGVEDDSGDEMQYEDAADGMMDGPLSFEG